LGLEKQQVQLVPAAPSRWLELVPGQQVLAFQEPHYQVRKQQVLVFQELLELVLVQQVLTLLAVMVPEMEW
jgi:hypothetical protein